jgi:paired amphipathic helix protein Sin3a
MIPEPPVQPTTAEAAFFERAKLHLHRKELMPDKPPNSRRHNPYTEFLKCLHLYGAGILNKEELVLLLRGLFMQGHAPKSGSNAGGGASNPAVANDAQELLREFEEILIGRGPYADQENALKDKSKYGAVPRREYDYSHCESPTPSYRTIPSDYPQSLFFSHSGQTEADAAVLNSSLFCVVSQRSSKQRYMLSPEKYDGVRARRNVHEEAMFKVEDERFEVDMAIDRNVTAMRQIEPMAEEVTRLRDIEEKEGQPIGRMTYRLRSRALHSSHINAIARLYGDKGDEVVQHLMRNPVAVLPIVYRRLRQKDAEWRRLKSEMSPEWNAVYEANYEGSLDVLCSSFKKGLERVVSHERLLEVSPKSVASMLVMLLVDY